ncbi:hypothetical protein Btru_002766 [Bulinus truncatus]|nr:hypothetical protein Btru_002766 [Bulinus truncatus]
MVTYVTFDVTEGVMDTKDISFDTDQEAIPELEPIVGGISPYTTTLDDPMVVFAVSATNEYYRTKGDNQARTVVKLISSTQQVVSGLLYRFIIQVTGGKCVDDCTVAVCTRTLLGDRVDENGPATQVYGDISCKISRMKTNFRN